VWVFSGFGIVLNARANSYLRLGDKRPIRSPVKANDP
jgi:hypothetical protein